MRDSCFSVTSASVRPSDFVPRLYIRPRTQALEKDQLLLSFKLLAIISLIGAMNHTGQLDYFTYDQQYSFRKVFTIQNV